MIEYIEKEIDLNGVKLIVSNDGKHIRTVERDVLCSDGRKCHYKGKELTQHLNPYGYYVVGSQPKLNSIQVSRLVAMAFLDLDPNSDLEVMHLDDNPQNNHYLNLKVGTHKENQRMISDHVRARNQHGKQTQIICIETGKIYVSQCDAARQNKVSQAQIWGSCTKGYKVHGFHYKFL